MMTIPKKVEYSILLISYLADGGQKPVSLMEVSKKTMLPYRFLGQLASQLKQGGLLESREGVGGGYKLVGDWKNNSIYDVLVMLGEDKHLVKCLGKGGFCIRSKGCTLRGVWKTIEDGLLIQLKDLKLGKLK